jgi:class 3 adenylate cyclase/tetratricopeptide (TPR) repeat protein
LAPVTSGLTPDGRRGQPTSVDGSTAGRPQSSTVDRPSAYIPGDRRRALAAGTTLPSRVRGAALFADISGFTPLTEGLADELGSQRASDVLTGHLNRVFHAVIAELDRYGGDVIYFSGDAITCWLDADDGSRAVACGFAMHDAIGREGEIATPGGLSFRLGLKVAIAVGPARRFVVGDPDIQLIDVLAGGLIDRLAEAEQLAETGEVVLAPGAAASLGGRVMLRESRPGADGVDPVDVVESLRGDVPDVPPAPADETLPDELARPWLLPAVYERLSTGRGEFLAELRPAFPVFVNFGGIDYDADESAVEQLDEFVRAVQRILSGYGGNVLQLTLGDKGAYLYGAFGTPLAHEDDAARACAAALEVRALDTSTAAREIRVGITHGRLRSGTYGHAERRTFVCLGDAVNLSARLMSKSPPGEIYVSEVVRRMAGDGFAWTRLDPLHLKGKADPVTAYALTGSSGPRSRRVTRYSLPIVGRAAELAELDARLGDAAAGRGKVVGISAEAGMGKSRLIAEFVRRARQRGRFVAFGECQSFGTSTSYAVWREIWRALFAVPESLPDAEQAQALQQALNDIDPALVQRAPLLDAVFGLSIPDTELTRSFDAKLRKTSLENLLVDCLRAKARGEPLVLVLEDCHWLDPLSRDLLGVIARAVESAPVLLVLAYRPEAASPQGLALAQLPRLEELPLAALEDAEMTDVIRSKLSQLGGADTEVARPLLDLVVSRAQGNPFYAEELLNYVDEQQIDASDESVLRSLELPGSLHSLVLSRIDTLAEAPRRTLKVASVVGRAFRAPVLPGAYPELGTIDDVRVHLGTLGRLDLVSPDREDDESYLFKHAVTHEVAYESLPYALRATLHGHVGRFIERQEPDAIERNLGLLAHHFWHGDDEPKKVVYLRRAGDAAQAAYANAAAIDYYERLAPLVSEGERAGVLLELGKVLELVGQWERARTVETSALELAASTGDDRSRAWCEAALAEVARKQSAFEEATEHLARARAVFGELGEEPGLGQVLHLEGTLAAQRGRYAEAQTRYEASLTIRRRLGDRKMMASVLSNLGVVAEYEGDYEASRSLHEQALGLRTELGDRWAIAVSMTNLGMIAVLQERYEEARERFDEAMRLNREVGDSWMVAISHNNLGNANRGLGDFAGARRHYADSLRAYREYDDQWALAFLLEDIAVLAALEGCSEPALELLGAADTLRDATGSPRGDALESEIDRRLQAAYEMLGERATTAARARGAALELSAALDLALTACAAPAVPIEKGRSAH